MFNLPFTLQTITNESLQQLCMEAGFKPEKEVTELAKGWWSRAYRFIHHNKKYVLRINNDDADFKKDKVVSQLLEGSGLPVPKIVAAGKYEAAYYAISEWCEGYAMTDENINKNDVLHLYECLWQLQQLDITSLPGWKLIDDEEGQNGWQEGLLDFSNPKMDYTIEELMRRKALPKEVVNNAIEKIQLLIPYCNTKKYLLHGDFGFDNALTDGKTITGIIDWAEARAGDFLYDIAHLVFNASSVNYKKLWLQFLQQKNIAIENMNERLLCYQLVIGLNSVAIAAHVNRPKACKEDLKKILNLL